MPDRASLPAESEVVLWFRAAHDTLAGWVDGLDTKVVELI